jgi:hypothetical protein
MWLITQHGFFSVVRDRENATRFLVRARVRKDLQNLKSLAGLEAEVQSSPEREYPFRLRVEEREFPRVMNALGNTVDYPSFTARIAQRIDQACRTLLYGEVMDSLRAIYDPGESPQQRPAPRDAGAEAAREAQRKPGTAAHSVARLPGKTQLWKAPAPEKEPPGELPFLSEPTPSPTRHRPARAVLSHRLHC